MSEQYVWLLTVGGELRAVYPSADSAAGAFDHAYRSDLSRSLTRVPVSPHGDEDDDLPWGREETYDVEFDGNKIVDVRLETEAMHLMGVGKWSADSGYCACERRVLPQR